jgi:hypothetical protein
MGVSGDYELDSIEGFTFAGLHRDLQKIIDFDTFVKTVNVMVKFQDRQSSTFPRGETLKDKICTIEKTYPISTIRSDAELLAKFKDSLEKSSEIQSFINAIKEAVELLSTVDPDKYPALLAALHEGAKTISDKDLVSLIEMYLAIISTSLDLDKNSEKIKAQAQDLLFSLRQQLDESSPIDLFHQVRTFLSHATPILIQILEDKNRELKELEETLQLPLDSEKVQSLIAPLREKMREKNKANEIAKVFKCYGEVMDRMQAAWMRKEFSSIDMKIVYIKRSNPNQDFVYEKKYSSSSS